MVWIRTAEVTSKIMAGPRDGRSDGERSASSLIHSNKGTYYIRSCSKPTIRLLMLMSDLSDHQPTLRSIAMS